MSREVFEERYSKEWDRLRSVLDAARSLARSALLAELPELYRRIGHHLALARSRHYGTDLEDRLNALALEAHEKLYARRQFGFTELARLFVLEFPRRVREELGMVLLATTLLVLPEIGMHLATLVNRDLAETVVPANVVANVTESFGPHVQKQREVDSDVLMFGLYIRNNIGIAFRTFASGIAFGVGAIFVLVYNGLFMGAITGAIAELGYGASFYSFVIGHGAFELTAIALSGAAGLRLGLSILSPGDRTREGSLREAGRKSLGIVGGAAVYLVVAAFLEAFWSSSQALTPDTKFVVGAGLWALVFAHLARGGRRGA